MRRPLTALVSGAALACGPAFGFDESRDDDEPDEHVPRPAVEWKLTPTAHHVRGERDAYDINLRGTWQGNVFWIGDYRRGSEFRQSRAGYERGFAIPYGKLVASAQVASRGFFGWSLQAEVGGEVYGILGIGRTNLAPYFNLNFDPNDAITWGGGWRRGSNIVTFYQVRDDRLGTGQRVSHLALRTTAVGNLRLTLDVFRRSGWSDAEGGDAVRATGVGVTVDHGRFFARVTRDPRVNFTDATMWRIAAGVRF